MPRPPTAPGAAAGGLNLSRPPTAQAPGAEGLRSGLGLSLMSALGIPPLPQIAGVGGPQDAEAAGFVPPPPPPPPSFFPGSNVGESSWGGGGSRSSTIGVDIPPPPPPPLAGPGESQVRVGGRRESKGGKAASAAKQKPARR